jgi:hypothetical protein
LLLARAIPAGVDQRHLPGDLRLDLLGRHGEFLFAGG